MSKLFSVITVATFLLAPTLVLPLVLGAGSAWAEGTPVRVRGTVVSLDGSKLVVHTSDGALRSLPRPSVLVAGAFLLCRSY
jgi:hypothetical protein